MLAEFAIAHWRLCNKIGQGHELACHLLGIENREALVTAMASATDNRAQVIALALVLGAYEDFTSTDTWRNPTPKTGITSTCSSSGATNCPTSRHPSWAGNRPAK